MKNKILKRVSMLCLLFAALMIFPSAVNLKKAAIIKIGFIPLTDCAPIVMAKEW